MNGPEVADDTTELCKANETVICRASSCIIPDVVDEISLFFKKVALYTLIIRTQSLEISENGMSLFLLDDGW